MGVCGSKEHGTVLHRDQITMKPPASHDLKEIEQLQGHVYESDANWKRFNAAVERQGWQPLPRAPKWMRGFTADLQERLCRAGLHVDPLCTDGSKRWEQAGLTRRDYDAIIDELTRPVAAQLYNDSDRSQASEHYWAQAQEQLFTAA